MRRNGIWLLSDETYAELTYGGSFFTLASARASSLWWHARHSRKCFPFPGIEPAMHRPMKWHEKLALSKSTLISCLPAFTQLGCLAGLWVMDQYVTRVRRTVIV